MQKFQELETVHLEKMRQILESYILSYENGNVLMGQVSLLWISEAAFF